MIPTLALIKEGKTRDYIVGFSDLGNTDEFSTEMLEWRIAQADLINYTGDLMTPPDAPGSKHKTNIFKGKVKNKTIKGKDQREDSSDEDDW